MNGLNDVEWEDIELPDGHCFNLQVSEELVGKRIIVMAQGDIKFKFVVIDDDKNDEL